MYCTHGRKERIYQVCRQQCYFYVAGRSSVGPREETSTMDGILQKKANRPGVEMDGKTDDIIVGSAVVQ
jgi:hypothetical protein